MTVRNERRRRLEDEPHDLLRTLTHAQLMGHDSGQFHILGVYGYRIQCKCTFRVQRTEYSVQSETWPSITRSCTTVVCGKLWIKAARKEEPLAAGEHRKRGTSVQLRVAMHVCVCAYVEYNSPHVRTA